jgi:hypothetical protein
MDSITTRIDELRGLMAVLGNAVAVLERDTSHPEWHVSQEQPSGPELRSSIYAVEAACAQLCSLVARPGDVLANVSSIRILTRIHLTSVSLEIFGRGFLARIKLRSN